MTVLRGIAPLEAASVGLSGVTKRFGDVVAVSSLTLEAEPGELLVLLGPSGCGKSTVLRLVAGLEDPSAGTVTIGGDVVNDVDPAARDVAMVFQSYALYPHMSVRKNIEFPLRARHTDDARRDRLVEDVARSLRLELLLDRKPAQLSGGQRQRVALARAIVRRPRVFLMDEPLSNLDAQLRLETRAELVELHARLGITILYVTHDQTEAMTMGHRIAVMDKGVLQQLAPPQVVFESPANAFVAGFIGFPPMNVIPARLSEQAGVMTASVRGGWFTVRPDLASACRRVGGVGLSEVLVGIRPEALRIISAEGSGEAGETIGSGGSVDATVSLVESFGREQHVACRLPGGQLVTVQLEGSKGGSAGLRTGDAVKLELVGGMHLFDSETGERIGVPPA